MPPDILHPVLWIIFALVYLAMALGRLPVISLDRVGAALAGAVAMLAVGGISLRDAAKSIDYQTILLLFGLMLFSAQLRAAGFYDLVGRRLTQLTAQPRRLLAGVILTSAALSALLANDIVCLAMTPVLCAALLTARRNPIPYLVALATASNIGSAATIIGNPQNMYIGSVGNLPFANFLLVMLPIVIVSLVLCWLIVVAIWRESLLHDSGESSINSASIDPIDVDRVLIYKTRIILTAVVAAFLVLPGDQRVIAALAGGALLLCSHRPKAARLYLRVDWSLLLLFCGLFVVNGTMKRQGLTQQLMDAIAHGGFRLTSIPTFTAVTTILSNIVSNVPAVLLLQPSIPANSHRYWYLLAWVSTLAGNLTLVGSIANLIVAEQANKLGVALGIKNYSKAGIPLTIITVVLGAFWIARMVHS